MEVIKLKRRLGLMLLSLLSIIQVASANPIDDLKNAVGNFFTTLIDTIKNVVKGIGSSIYNAVTAPFTFLYDSFRSCYTWLSSYAGPLTPIIYISIAGATIIIAVWIFKRVLNTAMS